MKTAIQLVTTLCNIADSMVESRTVQIGDEALRTLRDEVRCSRMQLSESDFDVGYEASCLIDCISELAYARTDQDRHREERALMYLNTLRTFLRIDVNDAARKKATAS